MIIARVTRRHFVCFIANEIASATAEWEILLVAIRNSTELRKRI